MQLIWSLDRNGTKLIWFDMKSAEMSTGFLIQSRSCTDKTMIEVRIIDTT